MSLRDLRKIWIIYKKDNILVKDIMSKKPFCIREDSPIYDIYKALSLLDVPYIPYLDKEGKYKGMLNLNKFIKEFTFFQIV